MVKTTPSLIESATKGIFSTIATKFKQISQFNDVTAEILAEFKYINLKEMHILPNYLAAKLFNSGFGYPMRELKVVDGRIAATAYYRENKKDFCMELACNIDFMSD